MLPQLLHASKDIQATYRFVRDNTKMPSFKTLDPCLDLTYTPYPYQQQAAALLDTTTDNILVSSPTGSGKSFLIHWAAKRGLERHKKVIVGVPLVALALQIYADLQRLLKGIEVEDEQPIGYYDEYDEYADYYEEELSVPAESNVGIWTGPSELHKDAPIMVCTYEIVLIQLNQNPTFFDGCSHLILDEIHSLSTDRGHVLESILTHSYLPSLSIVGLSGTIPNKRELGEMLGRCNEKPTHVIGMPKRPITLNLFLDHPELATKTKPFYPISKDGSFDDTTWKKVTALKELPKHVSWKHKMIDLVYRLKNHDKFPAMIVAFSCNQLNQFGYDLSMDLLETKKEKHWVHRAFARIQKKVTKEDFELFVYLKQLALRGICVHHSQQPQLYLEILPELVKRGSIKVILCTSTLSTGIDLPVKTVVVSNIRMPSKKGFRAIPAALLHQIFGRAGRPGMETEGNVILLLWTETRRVMKELLETKPVNVQGKGQLTVQRLLHSKLHHEDVATMLHSPFSSLDGFFAKPIFNQCEAFLKKAGHVTERKALMAYDKLCEHARKIHNEVLQTLKKASIVYVEDVFPKIAPIQCTVVSHDPLTVEDLGVISRDWVLFSDALPKKQTLEFTEHATVIKACMKALEHAPIISKEAEDMVKLHYQVNDLKRLYFDVESNAMYPIYKHMITLLERFEYIKGNVLTWKAKLAAALVGTEFPLLLIETYTHKLFPTTPAKFAAILSCFLVENKHSDPFDSESIPGIYREILKLNEETALTDAEPSCRFVDAIYMWATGISIKTICEKTNVNVGHFCKLVNRLVQLLEQLESVDVGNKDLSERCESAVELIKKGLPFVPSLYLR